MRNFQPPTADENLVFINAWNEWAEETIWSPAIGGAINTGKHEARTGFRFLRSPNHHSPSRAIVGRFKSVFDENKSPFHQQRQRASFANINGRKEYGSRGGIRCRNGPPTQRADGSLSHSATLRAGTETACDAAIPVLTESNSPAGDSRLHRSGASKDTIAVVIPYFKPRYLGEVLESLASQRDGDFSVFVGDDCSPDDPSALLEKYRQRLNITYKRFTTNLGRTSLPAHWTRCVAEVRSEWVWLFSDDDVASRIAWHTSVRRLQAQRVNTTSTDSTFASLTRTAKTHTPRAHPTWESSREFAFAKLLDGRYSMAVEYVFRRTAFACHGRISPVPFGLVRR